MQLHWHVNRSDDAGESWQKVSGNLPTDFGFPIDVHAHEPNTIYVVPIKSDSEHYPPEGKLRVYRSRKGGNDWAPLTRGLPQKDCYVNVLREAMAVDTLDPCGGSCGPPGGKGSDPRTPGTPGLPSSATSRPCCPSRRRRCHDPGGPAGALEDPGARGGRVEALRRRAAHGAPHQRCDRAPLPDAARDDPRPRHAGAPVVRAVLRLRPGPLP